MRSLQNYDMDELLDSLISPSERSYVQQLLDPLSEESTRPVELKRIMHSVEQRANCLWGARALQEAQFSAIKIHHQKYSYLLFKEELCR